MRRIAGDDHRPGMPARHARHVEDRIGGEIAPGRVDDLDRRSGILSEQRPQTVLPLVGVRGRPWPRGSLAGDVGKPEHLARRAHACSRRTPGCRRSCGTCRAWAASGHGERPSAHADESGVARSRGRRIDQPSRRRVQSIGADQHSPVRRPCHRRTVPDTPRRAFGADQPLACNDLDAAPRRFVTQRAMQQPRWTV